MNKQDKEKFMNIALDLALKAKEKTYPNPMVGCVIVKNNVIIGKAYHSLAGKDHAEIKAIKSVKGSCKGSTMFVTLEPCSNYGKTPPCTKAIIESGISNVIVGMKDPNPINKDKGIRCLKKNGINVEVGICKKEAENINKKYCKFIINKMPYVTIKLAQSIDGKIAARNGTSKWITGEQSRKYVKKIRSCFNGIMVGINTVKKDNPFLLCKNKKENNVFRLIVDTHLNISLDSNLINTKNISPIIIGTTQFADKKKMDILNKMDNIELIVTKSKKGMVNLNSFFSNLFKRGIVNILVEGGGKIVGSLIEENLVDEAMFFIAPKILGGNCLSIKNKGVKDISKAILLHNIKSEIIDKDILVRGELCLQV